MKECLDYIKKTGEEIKELNEKVQSQMIKNETLQKDNHRLHLKVSEKEDELKNLRRIANNWKNEYDELSCRYKNLEALYDAMTMAMSQIAPTLLDDIKIDREEAEKNPKFIWSEIIDNFNRDRW